MRLHDSAPETAWAMKLRAVRVAKGIKQSVVAARLGVNRASLCHWETGVSCPSTFKLWNRWAEAVGLPPVTNSAPLLDEEGDDRIAD